MAKFELNKNIEAKKLNKRTGVPIGGPPVTIPYGAIIDSPVEERHLVKFSYLGEPYQSGREVFSSAATPIEDNQTEPSATPLAKQTAEAATEAAPTLQWEQVTSSNRLNVMRAKVPGGWLVLVNGAGLTHYPDSEHRWS